MTALARSGYTALKSLPVGSRQLAPGEIVQQGDYLQIASSYYLVDGSIWVGDIIQHGGTFERVWRYEVEEVSPLDSEYGLEAL